MLPALKANWVEDEKQAQIESLGPLFACSAQAHPICLISDMLHPPRQLGEADVSQATER